MNINIGVDEVGRGPIAGPVTFCAFITFDTNNDIIFGNYKDSKKLTKIKREKEYQELLQQKINLICDFFIVSKSSIYIEKYGLSTTIKKCLESLILKIIQKYSHYKYLSIRLDGGLKFTEEFVKKINLKGFIMNTQSIIKGDEKVLEIKNASIIAKVSRDRYMHNINKKLIKEIKVNYKFDSHVGYGTKEHYFLINKYGLTKYHRKSWIKV